MKIARLVKILSIAFSILLLLVLAPVIFLLTLDPNDYKPEIETLALEQGVDLQIRGDLGWQIYPSIALELNDVALTTEQPGMSLMASLDLAQLDINLWPLFSGELSVSAINVQGVDLALTETDTEAETATQADEPEAQTERVDMTLPQLNVQGIALTDLSILYQPKAGDAIQLTVAEIRAQQFNLEGTPFPFGLEFDLDYSGQNLNLGMESRLTLDLEAQHYRLETESLDVGIAGDQDVSSQIDLVADVNMASGNWQLNLESMQIDDLFAQLQAEGLMEPLSAKGNLNMAGGAGFIGRITNTDMINNLALETGFEYSPEALVLSSLTATVNETEIEAGLEYFLEGQNTSQLRIDIGQVNVDQYLPAEQDQAATPANQNPLALLESVPPFDIQLLVDELTFSGYQLTDVQLDSDIADSRAVVRLQYAGFAEGDIEANLVLQATDQPQVQI
ncbi:MAG: AsmA family protein, partial [Pseudomonadales bacterium]